MAQQASLRVLKSPFDNKWMRGGMIFASMTAWIWVELPAVTLEMVQQASFRIPSFWELRRDRRAGREPQLMMICVCKSSPVTMLPTERRAGVCTEVEACVRSSTKRRGMPASITAWILSLAPSERYEIAQQASMSTSSSSE